MSSMKGKYEILVNILDTIRKESKDTKHSRYLPPTENLEAIGNARSRAFIHLYLKVMFGITEFSERERWITDDSYDGGIDAYYIDHDSKTIHIIQSKFRNNSKNFENKEIELSEILKMDIDRILGGEAEDELGNTYNGKIKQLQREVSNIDDVARYRFKVAILANLSGLSASKIRTLTGGYSAEVFDFQKSYEKLVFPVISGTYFAASEIKIPLDITNKSAGTKISYTVSTKASDCEITVLFVPAIEIAKIMSKYKNSILQFNPRSYLEFEGQQVNSAIRSTILNTKTNELALFNNGITIISDETDISEKVGRKNTAQLLIKNPQIINGGQTSYTLSKIYEEQKLKSATEAEILNVFENKEILVKVITLIDNDNDASKQQLIDEISNATNKQTPVIGADRFANDTKHKKIQFALFERCGLLYERKRGEFADGVANGYVSTSQILERNHFFRLYYAIKGKVDISVQRKLFERNELKELNLSDDDLSHQISMSNHLYNIITPKNSVAKSSRANHFAKLHLGMSLYKNRQLEEVTNQNKAELDEAWNRFIIEIPLKHPEFIRRGKRQNNGVDATIYNYKKYYASKLFREDIDNFVNSITTSKNIQSNEPAAV